MRHLLVAAALVLAPGIARAQDIYLARLTVVGDTVRVGAPVNITNRTGYDNQPAFSANSGAVLYTSTREDNQADIYRYDIDTKAITRLTKTAPESEYSATLMRRGERISVIRVEQDSTQRIWSFDPQGNDPRLEVPAIKPVGYHAWVDDFHVAMFVLGSPNTLQVADLRSGAVDTLARNIGRSVVSNTVYEEFSYVARDSASQPFTLFVGHTHEARPKSVRVTTLPAGAEYVAWRSFETVITGTGSTLSAYSVRHRTWAQIADFTAAGLTRISRLAISPDGQWIAIVAEPRP